MRHAEIIRAWEGRPSFAIVDLDALATNVQVMRRHVRPEARLTMVVKANGYGDGAVPLAETALANGADCVAVATVDEGAELRKAGITREILVMGPIGAAERDRAIGLDMTIVVNDPAFARGLAAVARSHGRKSPVKVHLKVDTGMRRMGVLPRDAAAAATVIAGQPELSLEGLMTHIASADELDTSSVHVQVQEFDDALARINAAGIEIPICHIANSATTVQFPDYHRDMVRPGLALHGVKPAPHIPLPGEPGEMRQILTVHSTVTRVIPLAPGDRVSYGGTWEATSPTRGAQVPLGYADGYLRSLSSRGWTNVRGQRAEVIGRVCMDQMIVHLPDTLDVQTGEHVIVIGDGTPETAPASDLETLAEAAGTIPHELMTGLAPRLPKLYVKAGKLHAVADLAGYRRV